MTDTVPALASTPTTHEPAPLQQWAYPFATTAGDAATVHTHLTALGSALGGFYPLGVNGLWHGGIHADAGTARHYKQADGVRCMADGRVVAYRLNDRYPVIPFGDNANRSALYSTGFVLVHHRLALPQVDPSAPAPADEILDFYSLYMHQSSWTQYLADNTMKRPHFWQGRKAYRIGKADAQAEASRVHGAHVREEPVAAARGRFIGGSFMGFLPEHSEVVIGEIRGQWGKLVEITAGGLLASTADAPPSDDAFGDGMGWIYLPEQHAVIEPHPLDSVVVLDPPVEIAAGDLIGHLGEYQNYADSSPLPPVPRQPVMHLEIFAGDGFPAFLAKSRARAAELPDRDKTLVIVPKGTATIARITVADTEIAAGLALKVVGQADARLWVKVQPQAVERMGAREKLTPTGEPVWVAKASLGGRHGCRAWSNFPLRGGAAGVPTGADRIYTASELAKLGHAVDDDGVRWWEIQYMGHDSLVANGWVSESATSKVSPFAWPGFEVIDATGVSVKDAFQRQALTTGRLHPNEVDAFRPAAEVVNGSQWMLALERAMDRNHDGTLDASELKAAMLSPPLAQGLSRIIGRYESEWGGNMARWQELTPLMGNGALRWERELERIEKLQWWPQAGGVDGLPGPTVYHFHPIGLIGNFFSQCDCINYKVMYATRGPAYRDDQIISSSHYKTEIDRSNGRLCGNSRRHGDASIQVQREVIGEIVDAAKESGLTKQDLAMVLAMARVESGFNPDAAAGTTTAAGLGQFIDRTGRSYGITSDRERFDVKVGARALIKHFLENKKLAEKAYSGRDMYVMIYALHHDGPSLAYGGVDISKSEVMPKYDLYLENICDDF
jgi:hypothetical protein